MRAGDLQAERVEPRFQMATHAIRTNQHQRAQRGDGRGPHLLVGLQRDRGRRGRHFVRGPGGAGVLRPNDAVAVADPDAPRVDGADDEAGRLVELALDDGPGLALVAGEGEIGPEAAIGGEIVQPHPERAVARDDRIIVEGKPRRLPEGWLEVVRGEYRISVPEFLSEEPVPNRGRDEAVDDVVRRVKRAIFPLHGLPS